MDNSKTIFEKEKREKKSKLVTVKFTSEVLFNVLDEEGNSKYHARIDPPFCECPSYEFGNTEEYLATHAEAFLCKHLIHAIALKSISSKPTKESDYAHKIEGIKLIFNQTYVTDESFVKQVELIMNMKLSKKKPLVSKIKQEKLKRIGVESTRGLIDRSLLLD